MTAINFDFSPFSDADFIALDFETANRSNASACALGLAFVKNGSIVANPSWLIKPPQLYFLPEFIKIHGIDADKVKGSPEFNDIWHELYPILAEKIIIAHNAEFDIAVLHHTLNHYNLPRPIFKYTCTKIISQNTWPTWKRYNLASLAKRLTFTFNHHDAGEDARVCAGIALQAIKAKTLNTLDELIQTLNLTYGNLDQNGYTPVRSNLNLPILADFGHWNKFIHQQPEQIKRQQRASGLADATIDRINRIAMINGYTVTPDSCTCIDFRERNLPCKHIYHLLGQLYIAE